MEIKKDIKNELMCRREIALVLEADKNPSFAEMNKMVAEHFKANEENVLVEKIVGSFGSNKFIINASIYDTKELKDIAFNRMHKPKKTAAPAA